MSGYSQPSFNPSAYEQLGRPLSPFRTMLLASARAGSGLYLAVIAWAGLITKAVGSAIPEFVLRMQGVHLINSRQILSNPAPDFAAAALKRWMIITVALCGAMLGVALIIDFAKGA